MLDVLAGALRISTPYTLAALGGAWSERSGVMNIALEAGLLHGALGYAVVTELTGNPWAGVLGAMAAGALTMLVHALLCIHLRANHIIVAVGLNLLAVGITRFALKVLYNSAANGPRIPGFEVTTWGAVRDVPVLGAALGNPLVVVALLAVVASTVLMQRTAFGLRVRAVGEHPEAAETQGINVAGVRLVAVVLGGVLCGLGGAYLAAEQHGFTQGMSAGRGFIAVSAVVFGRWKPVPVFGGCLLFGLMESVQISLQSTASSIPTQWVQVIPYAATLLVLAVGYARTRAPAALGQPYPPER